MSTTEPQPCSPCRGTGKVISNKGGDAHDVTCPWCGGTGVRPAAPPPGEDND